MRIVMVTPELAPAAKVGGLADVVAGLGRALVQKGHEVEVFLPMHHAMRYDLIEGLEEVYAELWVPEFDDWQPEQVFRGTVGGLPCRFFTGGTRFHREGIYGDEDDLFRYAHFNRAVLEYLLKTDRRPEILHAHDWTTGLVAPLLWEIYAPLGLDRCRTVFTIHNLEHQGHCPCPGELLGSVGLNAAEHMRFDRMQDNLKHDQVNLLKSGIVFSNFVTTVSPTYCEEICTPEGGKGLEATLQAHHTKLGGVLNGIDTESWNPETDPHLPLGYTAETFERKFASKDELRRRLHMPDSYRPVLSCISRLVPQKGLHLIRHAIRHALSRGAQVALLGSSPDPAINDEFARLAHELFDNPDVFIQIGYDEELSHLLYAGGDMLLVPSLFEPCGLTQLIALRYGTVPLVRHTGGLADTVRDVENPLVPGSERNGYVFHDPDLGGVESVIDRACEDWFMDGEGFAELARRGMRCDYSWRRSAGDYENIYRHIACEETAGVS